MPENIPAQNNQDPSQYFYPYETQNPNSYTQKVSLYKNKFQYYAVKVWPYVTKIFEFIFFWTKKTIGGIISIAKEQIRSGGS